MKIATGTVIDGRIEVASGALPEGGRVMVVSLQEEEPATLTAAEEADLLAASEEIRRGEMVTGEELIADLRRLADR